jgi:hypothetical protein
MSGIIPSHHERPVIEAIVQAHALMHGLVAACPISVRAVLSYKGHQREAGFQAGSVGFPHREPAPACTTADRVLWLDGADQLRVCMSVGEICDRTRARALSRHVRHLPETPSGPFRYATSLVGGQEGDRHPVIGNDRMQRPNGCHSHDKQKSWPVRQQFDLSSSPGTQRYFVIALNSSIGARDACPPVPTARSRQLSR